jgi:pimeloyl-ACP methyl ester carboxylesterase
VITAVYRQLPDRIARLVYLDAHAPVAPDSGQSAERRVEAEANGGMLPFSGYDPDPDEVGGPQGVATFVEGVMPQSFATFATPMGAPPPEEMPKTYVSATGYSPTRFGDYAAAAAADPAWDYVELPASHWLMFSHPTEVAEIILR